MKIRRVMLSAMFALSILLFACSARAEEDFSAGMIDRAAALAAAEAVTPEKYPDADTVLVDGLERVRYAADGTYVQWAEAWVKALTEKGRRANTTLSSSFTIPYQRGPEDCKIALVEIIKPGGKVVAVDVAKNSELMIDRSQMSMNIYDPNDKIIRLNVPGVEVGDTLHYVMYDRIVQPRIRDTFCDWQGFEGTSPIAHSAVEIFAPKERPLVSIALKDPVGKTLLASVPVEKDGVIAYRWEARDVPQIFPEPNMPPAYMVTQRVLVSTAPDWQSISRWYWKLSEPHYKATPEMQAEVDALIKGAAHDEQKVRAVFDWVSHEVRYLGITAESEAPGYEPHDVSATFSQRHGVCRDKAALLVVMLRCAGLDAFPVLIDTEAKKDTEVPQPYFNHAITAVRAKDGSYTLMDSTDESTRRLLPAYLGDKSYLVATPEGDPLRTSPIVPADENMMRIRTTGSVDAFGNLHATTKMAFDGVNDNVYRGYFSRLQPIDRRRYFEGVLQAAAPGAKLTDIEILPADMQDTATPLSVRLDFEAGDVLVRGGGALMLPVPMMGQHVGMANFILGQTGLKERKYPLDIDTACGVREEVAIEMAPSLGKLDALPASSDVSDAAVLWKTRWAQDGDAVKAEGEFQLRKVELSTKEYGALKDTLRTIELDLRRMPVYRAAAGVEAPAAQPEGNDIEVIRSTLDYRIADARTWTETREAEFKVLTYAGKKRFSELKIPFNPAWETAALDEGVVTSKTGEVRKIGPKEINVMDATGGTAPRYPTDKVLVANFPSVEVGSVVRYRFTRTFKDRPFVAIRESFRGFDPIALKTVRVTAPPGLVLAKNEINAELNGAPVLTVKPLAGAAPGWEWTAANVPPIRHEDALPPMWSFAPTVFVSGGDWKRYAAEVYPVLLRNALGQPAAALKAVQLTAGLAETAARVTALRDFVARDVRSAGPGLDGMPLSFVSAADRTLADGYGNTTDRAVLLYAMLSATGFQPEFVLASDASEVPDLRATELANPDYGLFDTVLVRVRVGKDTVYLNDSNQYAALGATAHDGRMGLALPAGELKEIAASADRGDRTETSYAVTLDETGDAVVQKTTRVFGNRFAAYNRQFSEMRPEDRRRYFLDAVAEISQNAEAVGDLTTDFTGYPGVETFSVRVKRFAVRDGDYLYLKAPESLGGLFGLRSDTRENPLYIAEPKRESVSVSVVYPDAFELVRMPQALARKTLGGRVAIAASEIPAAAGSEHRRTLSLVYSADLPAALVDPDAYGDLFDLNRRLSRAGAEMILLRKTPAAVPAGK